MNDMLREIAALCEGLRGVVTPFLGLHASRDNVGAAIGGDVTFDIDEKAEAYLETYMAERLPAWGYYSEDRGLQGAADPELILIVDPIDGTRPAAAGLEAACVSIAAVPPSAAPTMGDVVAGVVQEIRSGDLFAAEKGAGFEMRRGAGPAAARPGTAAQAGVAQPGAVAPAGVSPGAHIPLNPTPRTDIEGLFWTLGFRGRPALVLAGVLEELIDRSSVRGSVFDIGSATFSITRILTGQLDAYVDIGPAIIAAHPETEVEFRRVGMGGVLCNSPYDLAAAYLVCREAGVPIGDADGTSLDAKPVLGSDAGFQMACIASGNDGLQQLLVEAVQRGIARYRFLGPPALRGNPFEIGGP